MSYLQSSAIWDSEYDIRKVKCGGWSSSRLSVRKDGRWIEFYDDKTRTPINQSIPVDFERKYIPPKRPSTAMSQKTDLKKENSFVLTPFAHFQGHPSKRAQISDEEISTLLSKCDLAITNANESSAPKKKRSLPEEIPRIVATPYDFSNVPFPQTTRIIPKRKGVDPNQYPFRVSSSHISRLMKDKGKTPEMVIKGLSVSQN